MRIPIFKLTQSTLIIWLILFTAISADAADAADANNNALFNQNGIPTPQAIRDPFTPSGLMFEVVGKQSGTAGVDAYGFRLSPSNFTVPKMRLRGFVTQDESEPVALLEVEGLRTFIVREGDQINVDPSQPNSAIRISKITRLSVTVETGTLGSIRVQR